MYPLESACEWVNSSGGKYAHLVRRLSCWKRLTRMVSDNKDRGTCEVCNGRVKDIPPDVDHFVELKGALGRLKEAHRTMVRVTKTKFPTFEFGEGTREAFVVVKQDVRDGKCGVMVRNISGVRQTLPYKAIVAKAIPVYSWPTAVAQVPESDEEYEGRRSVAAVKLVT